MTAFLRVFAVVLVMGSLWIASAVSAASLRARRSTVSRTVGAPLVPTALGYVDLQGRAATAAVGETATLYMLVDSRCGHCELELRQLQARSAELDRSRVYVLTTESGPAASASIAARWPVADRGRAQWGAVGRADARALFGTLDTPVMLVVDRTRHVRRRFVGETRPDLLITELQNAGRDAPRVE